jgi:hypothetical protein
MRPSAEFIQASYFYVGVVLPASVLLPLGIGAYKRVYAQPALRIIFAYLLVSGSTNILASTLAAAHRNNLPLLHIYTIIELLLILAYYDKVLTGKPIKKVIRLLGLGFAGGAVLNFLLLQSVHSFNSYPRALASVIITFLGSYYFLTEKDQHVGLQPHKWINFGLIQYFGSAVFMFAFSNVIYQHASEQGQFIIGIAHATLVLIMYVLIGVGFMRTEQSG